MRCITSARGDFATSSVSTPLRMLMAGLMMGSWTTVCQHLCTPYGLSRPGYAHVRVSLCGAQHPWWGAPQVRLGDPAEIWQEVTNPTWRPIQAGRRAITRSKGARTWVKSCPRSTVCLRDVPLLNKLRATTVPLRGINVKFLDTLHYACFQK